jgi:ABC-type transport system involved in multi-copper enzyme maturation permease subunit
MSAIADTRAARPGFADDRPLPLLGAAAWIALFSFRAMARRRRLVAVGAVALVPVLMCLAWRVLDRAGTVPASLLLANLGGFVFVPFLTALVSLAFGLSAIGEELEEGTILYYWTRPIGREAIFLGRLVAAQTVSATLLVGSLALCFVAITVGKLDALTGKFVGVYLRTAGVVVLGTFVYTAIFAMIGTWLRRPLGLALAFAFGWESMTGTIPARIQQLTVVFHLRNLIGNQEAGTRSFPNLLLELLRQVQHEAPVPGWRSCVSLVIAMIVAGVLGAWLLRRKEIFR